MKSLKHLAWFLFLSGLLISFPIPAKGEAIVFRSPGMQTTLMEVYVSQGCSSCPPAQKWVSGFVESPRLWKDVIPVVFHVDYWDYLGWKDPFSSREFSDRQRAYAARGNADRVYTPGFMVNGKEWRGWFKGQPLPEKGSPAGVLDARLDGGQLSAEFRGKDSRDLVLNVALLGIGLETGVPRGENRGRLLQEDFVVLSFDTFPSENGSWQIAYSTESPHNAPRKALALWVSRKGDFTPLQAAGGWLPMQEKR